MPSNDAKTLNTAIRDLCEEFVAARYSQELDYIPLLWDALKTHSNKASQGGVGNWCAGLPFAADQGASLAAPFVLLTLEATLRELSARGHAPDLASIGKAVQSAAEALGASARLVTELVQDLPPRLATLFSADGGALSLADPEVADASRTEQLYIERRVNGQSRKPGWAGRKVRTENRKNERYDIVVDEIARELLIRENRTSNGAQRPEPIHIDDIDPRVATMLWFVLQHFGRTISFKELRRGLNLEETGAQDNGIHKAKSDLAKLLGNRISKKLFGRTQRQRYRVCADGVNFCWMRLTEDPQESELLYRGGAPGE